MEASHIWSFHCTANLAMVILKLLLSCTYRLEISHSQTEAYSACTAACMRKMRMIRLGLRIDFLAHRRKKVQQTKLH